MELIKKTDPQYFEQSSYEPYDRHKYKLTFQDGHSMILDSYEQVQILWFENLRNWKGVIIDVLDKDKEKKGFA
jgi:hypothetical protein